MGPSLSRALFWLTFAAYAGLIAWQAVFLPDRVPGHLDAAGAVTRWGTRTEHIALGVGVGLLALLLGPGSGALLRRLPRGITNIPHPEYWKRDEHWPEATRRLAASMWSFGVLLNLFFVAMMGVVGEVALGRPPAPWLFWVLLAAFLAATAIWTVRLYSDFRVPASPFPGTRTPP